MPSLPIVALPASGAPTAAAPPADASRPNLREEDLPALLAAFYEAVGADPRLAPYFAPLDMAAHLPRIVAFWSTMLWHTGRYTGNAFRPHLDMAGLDADHFARWVATLEATVHARHAGPAAERLAALGHRIAHSMQLRLGIVPHHPFPRADAPN